MFQVTFTVVETFMGTLRRSLPVNDGEEPRMGEKKGGNDPTRIHSLILNCSRNKRRQKEI